MSDITEDVSDYVAIVDETAEEQARESKGPDPAVWGDPADRLQADIDAGKINDDDVVNLQLQAKLDAGEEPVVVLEDGTTVKGPDPAVWKVPDDAPAEDDLGV